MSHSFWEQFAQTDPLWANLSHQLYQLRELGHDPQRQMAVDFGCGVGRLTQALGDHFERAIGIDVSPTMIRLAGEAVESAR
jgi:predicted TPR repeat methyltransferase